MMKIIIADKPEGVTSFSFIKRLGNEKYRGEKIGHAGTLDKFASGLMIVLVGSATKLSPLFTSFDKEYIASIRFGIETDTLDPEGAVIRESPLPEEDAVRSVIPDFIGRIRQVPPVYSAIHVDGKRAYREAREGHNVDMPSREVEISSLSLLSLSKEEAVIRASVSKGTYIRSLGRDIASKAGSAGYISALRRLRIGPWTLEDSGLSTAELLEKTGLFSDLVLPDRAEKMAENGFIDPDFLSLDTDLDKPFCRIRAGRFRAVGEKTSGKVRILGRYEDGDL